MTNDGSLLHKATDVIHIVICDKHWRWRGRAVLLCPCQHWHPQSTK